MTPEATTKGAHREHGEHPGGDAPVRSGVTGPSGGECHCHHVTKLQEDIADLKLKYQHFKATFGAKPFLPSEAKGTEHASVPDEPD